MKAIMVALLACVLVPAVALAQEGQAPAQGNLNSITSVNVRGGTVEIVGTKKPNFTTFTMTDPPRLVIDISEAVFSGVKEDISVGNGTITAIRTASYGSDESAIARVLIGYEREVETDIQATGNSLVVSVAGSAGAAVAQRPTAAPGTAPADAASGVSPAEAAVAAQAEQQQQEKAAAQAAVAAQAEQQQQEKAAAQAAVAAQAERQQQEKAAAQAAAAAQADAEALARAETERKAQEESARVAARQAEQQRLQQAQARKEAAAAAEKQRQQEEARAAAEERKRLAAEERERQREEARQVRIAQAETPRRAPAQGDRAGSSSRRKTMTLVGFRQEPTASRVFVRTNEPVRYTLTEGTREVVLELENTRIQESNNTRPLDTSFFDTAVASVDADVGPSRTVRVAIKLKEQVPYQTHQEGNEIFIEFQRPARR